MPYALRFRPGWDVFFEKMDQSIQRIIWKKIQKQVDETPLRHLRHGIMYYVLEIGQHRVAISINEKEKTKEIQFAGNHKQYEKWYRNLPQ